MTNRIYKYALDMISLQKVLMPTGARVLSAGEQDGQIVVWALGDTDLAPKEKMIQAIFTGELIEHNVSPWDWEFVGTVQMGSGLVVHVFAEK